MMKHQIDEKGKVFTDYVPKDPVQIIAQTATHRISGTFHVRHDTRLKDELNEQECFLAITEAAIFDRSGEVEEYRSDFLALHRDSIIWLIQQTDVQSPGQAVVEERK
jgi:hypothetical protein